MVNLRSNSWAAKLTKEQQWELYEKSKQPDMLSCTKVIEWAAQEYGLRKSPSIAAFYRWKAAMRKDELMHRITAVMCSTKKFLKAVPDDALIATFKTLAAEAALNDDAKTAGILIQSAATVHDHAIRQRKYEQEEIDRMNAAKEESAYAPYFRMLAKKAVAVACKPVSRGKAAKNTTGGPAHEKTH